MSRIPGRLSLAVRLNGLLALVLGAAALVGLPREAACRQTEGDICIDKYDGRVWRVILPRSWAQALARAAISFSGIPPARRISCW